MDRERDYHSPPRGAPAPTDEPESSSAMMPGRIAIKKVVRRQPQNILKIEHLMSRKGIAALPGVLSEAKYKGKGHELEDLRLLLSKAKHWAHRCFPALTFEDFVERADKFSSKQQLRRFVRNLRSGEPVKYGMEDEIVKSDGSDNEQELELPPISDELSQPNPTGAELAFDRLFKDGTNSNIDINEPDGEELEFNAIATVSANTAPKPASKSQPVDEFAMDDDDDDLMDEDFFASFKP